MVMGIALAPIVALIAGILILFMPKLLNYIVALYLIIVGILGWYILPLPSGVVQQILPALGLVSGYAGGRTDTAIQRLADIVANVPLLPLLIFLVFVLGSRLWLVLLILVAFGWPGLTIVVRAMALQLRSGPEVEAARGLGASRTRIVWRHLFPHIAPFAFAQLIFFAPSAILAEAGLSFLGLGDPSIPTWGQILEAGFRTGAVFLGYWWWVIPPKMRKYPKFRKNLWKRS